MKKEKKDFQLTKIFTQNIMKFPRETYLKKVIVLHEYLMKRGLKKNVLKNLV